LSKYEKTKGSQWKYGLNYPRFDPLPRQIMKKTTPGINFINMFVLGFFMRKTKKLLVFEKNFTMLLGMKIVLAVPFASRT
jgi:hypothetical protein